MRTIPTDSVRRGALLLASLTTLSVSMALAVPARATGKPSSTPTEIKVQREKPERPKLPMLRFLRANKDYLRAELDRLRPKIVQSHQAAGVIDPRFLRYGDMVASARAAGDSAAAADSARSGRLLFASVTELGGLESELDGLDRALAAQRDRLGVLQADFAGDQRTALAVVLSGWPGDAAPQALTLTLEDGTRETVSLSVEQRDALRAGGVVQVMHRLIEPRDQLFAVTFGENSAAGWLLLDPARDRLNLLRLDLTKLAAGDATSIAATTWVLDDRTP